MDCLLCHLACEQTACPTVPGDAVIVGSPLVLVGGVLGDNGGTASKGEGGVIGGHRRHVA